MGGRWTAELVDWVREAARAEGFALAGVAAAPAAEEPAGERTAERFTDWVEAGRAGEMEYLKRRDEAGELLRRSARVAMPWARSVVVCAFPYHGGGPSSLEPASPTAGWIGRYAWLGREDGGGTDYHEELLGRLRRVEARLLGRLNPEPTHHDVAVMNGAPGSEGLRTRCYVDTGPVLERDFAARAGVGWTGKNTCTLNQEWGSWLLLAVLVTSLELPAAEVALPAADRCGSCTRCLDACPTGALVAPREMDASRCIAYLTIEKKGTIAEELREGMGRQVFGCDICQEVCPWNGKAPVSIGAGLRVREELVNPELGWLAGLDAAGFRQEFGGTPLERTKLRRLRRNVAVAMGNSGEQGFVPKLREWAGQEDAVLAEAAGWALRRLTLEVGGLGRLEEDAKADSLRE